MGNRYDTLTIIAIAIIVYSLSSVLHEGVGHGGACLLANGHPAEISSVHFDCDSNHPKVVASGGTIVNLIVGFLCWIGLHFSDRGNEKVHFRYFLWLLMTVNLLQGGGYFLYSGIGNIGDWAEVIKGLHPAWAWRFGLTLLGVVSYLAFIRIALNEVLQFLPRTSEDRMRAAKKIMLLPYLTGGTLSCFAGMFNPVGMILVAISAAAASFGGTSGLAWMWQLLRGSMGTESSLNGAEGIQRDTTWIFSAIVLALGFVAVLGPGLMFSH